jgi:hypothetical protein
MVRPIPNTCAARKRFPLHIERNAIDRQWTNWNCHESEPGEKCDRLTAQGGGPDRYKEGKRIEAENPVGEERPGFQKRLGTTARRASPIAQTSAIRSSLQRNLRCGSSRRLQQGRQFVAGRFLQSYSLPAGISVQVEHHNTGAQETERTGIALLSR